jgi:coenzyme F420-reducing hydrogenase delta subunit
MMGDNFEPKIIGYLCNWCCYAGADLAGVSRIQYPTNIRIIRVMCSSRIEPHIILEMFIQGVDGVFVGGCHYGDCHYIEGNFYTFCRMEMTKKLLERVGLDPNRLRLEWVSAAEGMRFAEIMDEMKLQIEDLGPSPVSGKAPNIDMMEQLIIAKNVSNDFRLRLLAAKTYILAEKGNVYNKLIERERLEKLMDEIIDEEMLRHKILNILNKEPRSVKDMAKDIGSSPREILEQVVILKERGLIGLKEISGSSPIYNFIRNNL